MDILISGATGMIGLAISNRLRQEGHLIHRLTRSPSGPNDIHWNPEQGVIHLPPETHFEAVIHLAGENIAGGRWSQRRRQRILESRQNGTRLLCQAIKKRPRLPSVFISASGINYYEITRSTVADESTPQGSGFLSQVCQAWESEAQPLRDEGVRVCLMRLAVVLSSQGGALAKILPPFRLGIGGRIGTGTQRMSWVALPDVVQAFTESLSNSDYVGPINLSAPQVVTNSEFTKTLAKVLKRPALFTVPAFAIQFLLGQMAEETLLADLAVKSNRLN
jgi:uncharacterized protein (TIGR01777 family)